MRNESLYEHACTEAREMLRSGASKREILGYLTSVAEKGAGPGTVASILLLDAEGLLRDGASPRLPSDYLSAIDGLKPNPGLGTCASAAATGCMVITPDFCADDKWAELKHLPLALGFQGAWSMPIKTSANRVLGTFGTYYPEKREPSPHEIAGVERLSMMASDVLLHQG